MAGADYFHCDECGAKAFYDANVDWDAAQDCTLGDVKALCKACDKTHMLSVVERGRHSDIAPELDALRAANDATHKYVTYRKDMVDHPRRWNDLTDATNWRAMSETCAAARAAQEKP